MWQFQAMLQLIPAVVVYWVTVILFFGGIGAYLISKFIKFIPFINKYKLPVELAAVVAIALGGYLYGGVEYRLKAQEMAAKVKEAEEKGREANKKLEGELKKKDQQIKDQANRLRDAARNNATRIDSTCKVDSKAIEIINEAAKEPKKQ